MIIREPNERRIYLWNDVGGWRGRLGGWLVDGLLGVAVAVNGL